MKNMRHILPALLLTLLTACGAAPPEPTYPTPEGLQHSGTWVVREDQVMRLAAGAAGHGTLIFRGWEHGFSFSGAKVSVTGTREAKIKGVVYNLETVEDFNGTYVPTMDFVDGKIQGVWGKNDKGVVIYLNVEGEDMTVNMDAQGATVTLN